MSVRSLETGLSELRSEPKGITRNRLEHADFTRNFPDANHTVPSPVETGRNVGRLPILLTSRARISPTESQKETARRHALT
jgi:hypothetical protein